MISRCASLLAVLVAPLLYGARIEQIAGGGESQPGAPALQLRLIEPFGVDFDASGNWYIIELAGNRLLKVTAKGATSLLAGPELKEPHGVAITRSGQLFIADTHHNRIGVIDLKSGALTPFAGTGEAGFSGDGGPANAATFNGVFAIALDPRHRNLYIADLTNRRIRRIELATRMVTTVAGTKAGVPADGAPAAESPLVDPRAVAADSQGNVYILERRAMRCAAWIPRAASKPMPPVNRPPDLNGPETPHHGYASRVIIADAENHLFVLTRPPGRRAQSPER